MDYLDTFYDEDDDFHPMDYENDESYDSEDYDPGENWDYDVPSSALRIDGKPTSAYSSDKLGHFNRELQRRLKKDEEKKMYKFFGNPSQRDYIPHGHGYGDKREYQPAMRTLRGLEYKGDDSRAKDSVDPEGYGYDAMYANRVGDWTGGKGSRINESCVRRIVKKSIDNVLRRR